MRYDTCTIDTSYAWKLAMILSWHCFKSCQNSDSGETKSPKISSRSGIVPKGDKMDLPVDGSPSRDFRTLMDDLKRKSSCYSLNVHAMRKLREKFAG